MPFAALATAPETPAMIRRLHATALIGTLALTLGCLKPPTRQPTAVTSNTKTDLKTVTISAEELGEEWTADREAAAKKYSSMSLQSHLAITGNVKEFSLTIDNEAVLLISCGARNNAPLLHVILLEPEPWARYASGQSVTVTGQVSMGALGTPIVKNARITDVRGPRAVALTAAELASESEKDREGTVAKYTGKSLLVTGEVVKVSADGTTVFLKGTATAMVECKTYARTDKQLDKQFQPGTTITLHAVVEGSLSSASVPVSLKNGLPINHKNTASNGGADGKSGDRRRRRPYHD